MKDQNWTRKEYETWDDAFRGLMPAVRQQSVRVAAYTQVLFVQACASSFGGNTPAGKEQIRGEYGDLAYKCGMYHQLGKALVPPEYQLWQADFTEEERAVYRKYTTDGRLLCASLQERTTRARERRRGELLEQPTENIPWLMIRESCQQHMERWDGSGYPDGRVGENISPIAQIVGLAKELDRLCAETKSEDPFGEAYDVLTAQSGTAWSPELIEVLKAARSKCRGVYNKYIRYTMALPKTIPLVKKRKDRPMGLSFRPMVDGEGKTVAYEAVPWFGGIADQPGETETIAELEEMLRRTNLVEDMSYYFLYEAADALLRIQNCKLELDGILLQMMPSFYKLGTQLQRLNQLFTDQPVSRDKLMLTVPFSFLQSANKADKEILGRYMRAGIALVLDGYNPAQMSIDEVTELGFTRVRFAPELHLKPETSAAMIQLREKGVTLLGGGADTWSALDWLKNCGAVCASGTFCGVSVNEDELIRDCLAGER